MSQRIKNESDRPSHLRKAALSAAVLALSLGLAACDGDDGRNGMDGMDGTQGPAGQQGNQGAQGDTGAQGPAGNNGQPAFSPATLLVASNGATDKLVRVRDESLALLNSYVTGANEGIVVDAAHRLTQAQDAAAPASLVTACNATSRSSTSPTYSVTNAAMASPKGLSLITESGLVVVANVGASNLLVYGTAAAGDRAPLATVSLGANAWDTVYDDKGDRLFVAQTDGAIAVFDNFASDLGQTVTPRIFTSSTAGPVTNMHGIDYDAASDRLVVSDVGSAADATDGSLYVFENASTATGTVTPLVTIAGPSTMLGNPVDLQLDGGDVRIAEKSNDAILIYRNIFEHGGGDVAADVIFPTTKPESLAVVPDMQPMPGASDVVDPTTSYSLLYTSNPGAGTEGEVYSLSRNLGGNTLAFTVTLGTLSAENITIDRSGTAYVAYDGAVNGFTAVSGFTSRSGGTDFSRDRNVAVGSGVKGLELADDLGLLLMSNPGGGILEIYSTCAVSGDAPIATIDSSSLGAGPWDSDYDPMNDTLYLGLTNGLIAAYENFSANLGDSTPRVITPVTGGLSIASVTGATNVHSLRYDQRSDTLIVADVGLGGSPTDGSLYTIENAASAEGNTEVGKLIAGLLTGLGNPVDLTFDGVDLFVAEKANGGGAIQVWRNFLTDTSLAGNIAPSDSVPAVNPESIVIVQK